MTTDLLADRHRVLSVARALVPEIVAQTHQLTEIPAPTGSEGARAAWIAALLQDLTHLGNVESISVDHLHNVTAVVPGRSDAPPVVLAAHIDTVFPVETPLTVVQNADQLHGPGVGDNAVAVATMLALPKMFNALAIRPSAPVILAATVGEEGLGNLRGVREVLDRLEQVGAVIAIEGHNLGRVTHVAVGSQRWRVTVTGPGGHSWGDYGQPSAIHAMGRLIAALDGLQVPGSPKTTVNVGLVEGGVSVNTIAPRSTITIDLRSTSADVLRRLADEVQRTIQEVIQPPLRAVMTMLGERPAGTIAANALVVRRVRDVLGVLDVRAIGDASSTDANVPISRGIPAVCVGVTTGGNVHRIDEYIDLPPVATGLTQLGLLALMLADDLAAGRLSPRRRGWSIAAGN